MTPAADASLGSRVERAIRDAGAAAVGTTGTDEFPEVRRELERRRSGGLHGGMAFTFRDPARSTQPGRLLRDARAMVVAAMPYGEPRPPRPAGCQGRVARYAWRDHYGRLREALGAGAEVLRAAGHRATVVTDQNGLVDRAAAHRAGLAWWGRNSNLLVPGSGSWHVLGAVVTDAPLPASGSGSEVEDGCRACTRCIPSCPTGAIVGDGVIDARRCLAWIVQDTGVIPRAYRRALGDRIYGCDDCQDACPVSRSHADGGPSRAQAVQVGTSGDPRPDGDGPDAWVDVIELLASSDDELLARHGRWYIPQRQARYLRRNALVVLGNVGDATDPAVRETLERHVCHPDPLLRVHAVWACDQLGLRDLVEQAASDDAPAVRAEVALAGDGPAS